MNESTTNESHGQQGGGQKTPEELLRLVRGLEKKHGAGLDMVVKVKTQSGKVRRRTGRFVGLRNNLELGIVSDANGAEAWFLLSAVHDVWKRG